MKRSVLVALLALSTTSAVAVSIDAPEVALQPRPEYEQVDGFHFFGRLDNWRAVDRDTLIVWTTPFRPYLVELSRESPDLRFAEVIGVTSTVGTVHAKLDSVLVRGLDYPIRAIYKLSRDEAREIRQIQTVRQHS